jgi:quercetin 2,3-dioxygenase
MSGPVAPSDATPLAAGTGAAGAATLELLEGRSTEVGGLPVTRSLPKRQRRTVGAWCFADHFGPAEVAVTPMRVGPHPHIGLQTVTWVLEGEVVHRDSLGSEQPIRPGELNLMTAGGGVAHAEETPERTSGVLHGVQLWVAQPDATRFGEAAFEHHPCLPQTEVGPALATVLVGTFAGVRSPARADTPLVGADIAVTGGATIPLDPGFEHALIVVDGTLDIDGDAIRRGCAAYLGRGRDEIAFSAAAEARLLLLGGPPFPEEILMWWNFVGRTTAEIDEAFRDWQAVSGRFGEVHSGLSRMAAPRPGWMPLS